jgi:hypothetical protein
VVPSITTKRLFGTLAHSLSEEGASPISALSLQQGWGDIVLVRIHTPLSCEDRWALAPFTDAVKETLDGQRHRIEIVWDSAS